VLGSLALIAIVIGLSAALFATAVSFGGENAATTLSGVRRRGENHPAV
jgi:hypothetical protein